MLRIVRLAPQDDGDRAALAARLRSLNFGGQAARNDDVARTRALREERDLLGLGHAAERGQGIVGGGAGFLQDAAGEDGCAE